MKTAAPPSFFPWKPACWLRVEGPDAFDFLQGQFSNDLRALLRSGPAADGSGVHATAPAAQPGATALAATGLLREAVYGLWLNRKGRILGDGFVLRAGEESFFVCSYEMPGAALHAHLESFIVADEVELTDESPAAAGLTLLDGAARLLSASFAEAPVFSGANTGGRPPADSLRAPGRLAGVGGAFFTAPPAVRPCSAGGAAIEWVGEMAARETLLAQLDEATALSADEMERRRILAKLPAVPRDLGAGDLPQEGGPDFEQAAISYTKGCYLGQEVMSRLHSMGRVRRQLVQVRLRPRSAEHALENAPIPAPEDDAGAVPFPEAAPADGAGAVASVNITPDARASGGGTADRVGGDSPEAAAAAVPELPVPLYLGEKKVGELRTAIAYGPELIGLALIAAPHLPQAATPLALSWTPRVDGGT